MSVSEVRNIIDRSDGLIRKEQLGLLGICPIELL